MAGRELSFRCTAEPPEEGWRLVGYDYRLEGWVRLPESEDIEYLSGFTAGAQPYSAWTRLETGAPSIDVTVTPAAPGHYTLHARAVLARGSGKAAVQRPSAYAGRHTYLVTVGGGAAR